MPSPNGVSLIIGFLLLSAAVPSIAQPDTPATRFRAGCDKTCLTRFAERYLDALVHRQPSRVPLAPNVRFTENRAELAIGDALWATADALGDNIDEESQVVSGIATFDHRGNPDAVAYGNPRGVTPAGQFSRPFSFLIFESWKVIDGKIRQIEATVYQVPYRMSPGWPAP